MDEKYISDLYNQLGGKSVFGEYNDFKSLIMSDDNYASDVYNQMGGESVFGKYDDFRNLTKSSPSLQLKKKGDTTELPSEVGSSALSASADPEALRFAELVKKQGEVVGKRRDEPGYVDPRKTLGMYPTKEQADRATAQAMADIDSTKGERKEPEKKGGQGYVENLFTNLGLGAAYFNEGIASIPESVINLLAIPQNYVAEKTGWDIGVTADGIKKSWGITNPLLDYIQEDKKVLSGEVSKFIAERYEDPSIVGNFQKGNYQDGFELLGSAISQSLPTSIGLIVGGAKMTPAQLSALTTVVLTEGQRQELAEMDPTMPEAEKTTKALTMAALESVFSSIGTGTIGKVYKDILKREGPQKAGNILKEGLVVAYQKALEKSGPVAGFLGNSLEETAVQISQNVVAGRPAFEGAADAFVTGGGQGVVFTAPIGAINAKRYLQGKVESYQTKDKIGQILGDKADDIDNLYNVPVASEITAQQLEVANLPKSRDILVERLKKAVADNKITQDEAKQSLFVFDKTQQVSNSVKDLDVSSDNKAKIATLLRQRDELKAKIQNKDDVLVVQEKQKIEDINNQIQEILSTPQQEVPSYKVDGKDVSVETIDELIKTKSKEELLAMNIEIKNDPEGRVEKFQAIINPEAVAESGLTPEQRAQEIESIELDLNYDDRMIAEGGQSYNTDERRSLEKKLQTLKAEQDAIQEQAAGEVPVQPRTGGRQELAEGVSQAEPQVTAEAGVQEEVVSLETQPAPTKKKKAPAAEPTAQAQAQPATAPITITDIKVSFAPENAVEVQRATREDTRGRKLTYDAAVTAQATDQNGTPIGLMTKRSNEDGTLSFTLKNTSGQNINKGKAYPTERDARMALAEQVNRVRAKATPAPVVAPAPTPVAAPAPVVVEVAPVVAPEPEPILVNDQAEPILVTAKEIKSNLPKFTRDNAIEYDTDYKEDSMGRDVEYTSLLMVEALDIDGVEIGTITKLIDDEKNATYTAQDLDRVDVGRGKEYDSEAEVIKALTDHINKKRKKEFDKEVAKIVKAREKAATKAKLAEERKAAKQAAKEKTPEVDAVIEEDANAEGVLERSLDFLDNASKSLGKRLKTNANDALLGIPLSTLKLAIDAARVLVRAGVALRDAIAKVSKDYNLAVKDVEESLKVVSEQAEKEAAAAMPMSADNVKYSDSDVLPKPDKKVSNSTVAKLLQEVAANFWGGSIVTSETITPEQERLITINGTEETIRAFESSDKNAADWYSKAIETAVAVAGVIHPELSSVEAASKIEAFAKEKDPVKAAQMALRMALAITSQNLNVDANTTYAEEQFNYYKKNGKFDPSKKYGAKAPAISSNLKLANLLIDKLGLNGAENFVSQDFTVNQLEEAFQKATGKKVKISGLRNDDINGAAIFGPKIGQGFLQNLMGKFDPVTIDLWMRRTWGRWTGDVVGTGVTDKRMARLILAVNEAVKNKEIPKSLIPKEFFEYKPIQEKNEGGDLFWTMNDKFNDRIENDLEFLDVLNKFTKELTRQANNLYKAVHDIPMTKELYGKFLSGEMSYFDVANKLMSLDSKLKDNYSKYVANQKSKGLKALPLNDKKVNDEIVKGYKSTEYARLGNTYSPSNEEISQRKPIWGNAAKNIVVDLNPIDIPSNLDRRVITRVVNNIRKNVNARGYNVTNADVQALLWYPEKDIWAKLRGEDESILKLSYDDQFIKIAKERGLGKQAEAVAEDIRGRRTESDIRKDERRTDGKVSSRVDELAEIDVKTPSNAESVINFLDGVDKSIAKLLKTQANDALLGIPLTAVRGMIQGIKALVETGVKLRDAINKIAADNNITKDNLKDLLELASISNEFNALMTKADKMIARQKSRRIPEKKIVSNLDTMVRDFYKDMNVNDAQRKIMEREARARMGVEPRKAASIGRVIGVLKDITNVTREEKLKIIGRIRELGRDVAKDLANEIRAMAKGGTITTKQSADIIARFGKVNMLNEKSVSNFVDYMAKVFADAEYTSQLKTAVSTRKSLLSLSKNKDKAANLKTLASKFAEIDPSMVEDIYEYNKIAKMIEQSVEGSSIKGKDVKFASIVQEGDVMPYINKTLEAQRKKLFEEKLKEVQDIIGEIKDILGVDAKDLSYEDLLAILSENNKKSKGKDNDKLVRDAINKAFDVYSSVIKSIIKTGVDPFTGQEVKYTDAQKKIISDFMDMDLNIIPTKQALEAVDAALNFLQNKSTAKMTAIFDAYTGEKNSIELAQKGVRASVLRKVGIPGLGRFFGEQTTNLGLLFERLFKGFEAGGVVQDAMGLTKLINGKSQAQNESNRIINDYVNEFYKKKANNEAFNTELNNVERGMAAFMMRNVIGTAAQIKAEFNRRKNLIKESIEELSNGNEKEVAKSLIYQDVYDNILKDAKTIDDVISKVDAVNLDAVKFWQDQWQSKYDELSDVSVNVYNKILEKDINYTPDKYARLSTNTETVEITENDMAFNVNNGTLYSKETGVLMEATRPDALPADRFIDLSFDSNNANSMYDALVDIKTAGPIRQVQAFLNSKSFKKIFPNAEDAVILKGSKKDKRIGRIELFTRNFRNKNPYSEDEFSNAVRNLNRLANVGVSQALGGVFQPIKQVIPAAMNTLINGGSLDIDAMTNPDKIKFMMDSGYAIGFRGVESQAQVESLNRLMDMAAKSKGEAAIKYIEEANKIWLKVFLVKPDVFIARASWMTYYEQSLEKQGIDAKGIDYSTHKLNEKAANYAQRMLDRQQNVSDADLSGKLFSEKNPGKQVMMKVFMPFASFRMNQSARLGADIATITSKVSTQEDRKIAAKSLAGFAVEMATFRALSIGISLLTASVVAQMMGVEEEDEEKKKKSIIKGQATNTVSDILSPIPFTDPIIQAIAATTLQSAQDIAGVDEEEMISLFSPQDKGYLEQIGLFGFAAQRVVQTGELVWMSSVGSYRDSFGKKKYVSDDDKEALRLLIGPALLTNMGLAPSEMNSVVRASMSAAKKNSSTKKGGSTSGKDYESQMLDVMEENLLEGYENKTELKRYNPRLYEQNFGEGSEYYELTKEKRAEEKKTREEEQKEKDAEYGYRGKGKGFGSRSKSSGRGFGSKKFGGD